MFGARETKDILIKKGNYKELIKCFTTIIAELEQRFSDPSAIEREEDKKDFVKLFGDYLRVENELQNYDEFTHLRDFQDLDVNDKKAVEAFKEERNLSDEDMDKIKAIHLPTERQIQDYRSTYNDIHERVQRERAADDKGLSNRWDDVVFEIDLFKSQEYNLDYILKIIFEHYKKNKSKSDLIEEVRRMIRASFSNRAKESLLVDFVNKTNFDRFPNKDSIIDAFYRFAREQQRLEAEKLISAETLNQEAAKRYIEKSVKQGYANDKGTELNNIFPTMSPLSPKDLAKKQGVFDKIKAFVEKFKGIGGQI